MGFWRQEPAIEDDYIARLLASVDDLTSSLTARLEEAERVAALLELQPAPQDIDVLEAFAAIAQQASGSTQALVTMVGPRRQTALASSGKLDLSCTTDMGTSQESTCKYVVYGGETVAAADLKDHPEWSNAGKLGFDSYLGAPWYYKDQIIGSFCLLDEDNREWTNNDRQLIEACAAQVTERFEFHGA